jgi:hypothetical protein
MEQREATKNECEHFDELEEKDLYTDQHDGSFEASKGDYEGACLARAEFEAGYIS